MTIASRGSRLARWQAEHVQQRLRAMNPGLAVEVRIVRTTGDAVTDVPLARIGGKGLFTKEVDRALLDGEADLAVHSLKDLPTTPEPELALGAVLRREDPRDVVVFRPGVEPVLRRLPAGSRIGTSSLRRRSQALAARPDLEVADLRGNLDTRLARVEDGDYDAIIVAAAGILRLGRDEVIGQWLEPPDWLPAVGQGALGITVREGDDETLRLLEPLRHAGTTTATTAERAFLNELEGGCQVPIGALGRVDGEDVVLDGLVASLDGETVLRDRVDGPARDADRLGRTLAARLVEQGAEDLLAAIRAGSPYPGPTPP